MSNEVLDVEQFQQEGAALLERVARLEVKTQEDAQQASDLRGSVKSYEKKVKAHFEPHKERAAAVHKGLCTDEKKHLAPAIQVIALLDQKLLAWKRAEDAKLAELRRQAAAAARKTAEDQAIAMAAALDKPGRQAEAQAVIEAPVQAPVIRIEQAKVAGLSFRENYEATVLDQAAFVKAAAERSLHNLLEPNATALRQFANSPKGAIQVDGLLIERRDIPMGSRRA